jgi:hypothetical protein
MKIPYMQYIFLVSTIGRETHGKSNKWSAAPVAGAPPSPLPLSIRHGAWLCSFLYKQNQAC